MTSLVRLVCVLAAVVAYASSCADFTWGDNCEYQKCGCDGKNSDTCPDGTWDGLPCCELCPQAGWNCKCGDGCEGTDNCCMYCPSRWLKVGEKMEPFFIMQKPGSIVIGTSNSRNQHQARCQFGTTALYINSAYAEAELEKYINDHLQIDGDMSFWLDGYAAEAGSLPSWSDWDKVSRTRNGNCMMLSNHHAGNSNKKNWEIRAGSCSTNTAIPFLCMNTDDYFGSFYNSLDVHQHPRLYGAYYTEKVACNSIEDPYIHIRSEQEADQLQNEIERLGYGNEKFYIRGYTDATGLIKVSDIIQAPVKYGEEKGRYCVLFRIDWANGTRGKWELLSTRCVPRYTRYASISVCSQPYYELY